MYRVELYARVRRACHVEGMSTREASRVFGVDRKTVRKMLSFSVPPGYRRSAPPRRPKLGPFTGIIDRILEDDRTSHRKQRHTAKRIFDRLRDEYGFTGGYTIVKDYVREQGLRSREVFVPLSHSPGHAQADFGEAMAVIGGALRKIHFLAFDLHPLPRRPGAVARLRGAGTQPRRRPAKACRHPERPPVDRPLARQERPMNLTDDAMQVSLRIRAPARQRMAARAPTHHGRRPRRDRRAGRHRRERAQAHRLHGGDRLVPRPRLRARGACARPRPRTLAARRLTHPRAIRIAGPSTTAPGGAVPGSRAAGPPAAVAATIRRSPQP